MTSGVDLTLRPHGRIVCQGLLHKPKVQGCSGGLGAFWAGERVASLTGQGYLQGMAQKPGQGRANLWTEAVVGSR